jgi:hypothetical protein
LHQACSSQLATSLQFTTCSKSAVHNLHQACSSQLAASLFTTCNKLDIIKPEQAMRTHLDIGLMIASCIKSAADLLQLARFWLCKHQQVNREFKLHVSGNGKRQVRSFWAKLSLNLFVSYFLSCVERIIMYFSCKTASSFTLYCLIA